MSYTFKNTAHITDQEWEAYYELTLAEVQVRSGNLETPAKFREFKEKSKALAAYFAEYLIFDQGKLCGWLRLTSPADRPEDFYIMVRPEVGSEELKYFLLQLLSQALRDFGSRPLPFYTDQQLLISLSQKLGLKMLKQMNYYELAKADIDLTKLDKWADEFPPNYPGLRLEFFTEIPSALLDEYCALYTELFIDMPNEYREQQPYIITRQSHLNVMDRFKKSGEILYTLLMFDEKNEMIGMTNVVTKRATNYFNQVMTGVKKQYRGKGFGKWLKSVMYKKMINDFPEMEKITTDTTSTNIYMQNTNSEFGFKLVKDAYVYELTAESLNKMLKQKELI